MYGLVNAAIQDLIVTNFGEEKWEDIKKHAGVELATFNRMQAYPDDVTYKLVGAVSEALGISSEDALRTFGEFWVLYTGREGYGHLFDIAGTSMRDFLYNLDALHSRIGGNFPQLKPPSFQCEDVDPRTVRMHYFTDRAGLCPMVIGLLAGLGKHFKTEVEIDHPICVRHGKGADHCEFVVRMTGADVAL